MGHTKHKDRLQGGIPLALLLFAMGLRVLYLPMHLAHEDHLGMGNHSGATTQSPSHGHGHDHHGHGDQEEDGHTPHPVTDHACDLIVVRTATQRAELQCPQLQLRAIGLQPAPRVLFTLPLKQDLRPPSEPDRYPKRQRGPPAAS